jgi:hypothetical protein
MAGGRPALSGANTLGMRGQYAREMRRRREILDAQGPLPWDAPGLSRCERVIAFLEDLAITSGKEAGKKPPNPLMVS